MKKLIAQIDNLLPQTQCKQCGYDGCLPYAKAIAKGETFNRCLPGGIKTLKALAGLLKKDADPFLTTMKKQEIPPKIAFINETVCIGCTKCIQACPVDAILGAAKQLHIVLTDLCTGCGLCVTPCPIDCIDMITLNKNFYKPEKSRQQFYAKKERLKKIKLKKDQQIKKDEITKQHNYIEEAIARSKNKKLNIKLFS